MAAGECHPAEEPVGGPVENPFARHERGSANDVVAAANSTDLTIEHASRLAVLAVATDLEYWARAVSTDGYIGLNDLVRTLDIIRDACAIEAPLTRIREQPADDLLREPG
jgi:hypothetical protein